MAEKALSLQEVNEQIQQCMKCGNCQAVCPIYAETFKEAGVARGKIQLAAAILKGELKPSRELQEKFTTCLTCKACEVNCPCGVKCVDIILAGRTALAEQIGLPLIKSTVFKGLKNRPLFNLGMKMGSTFQGIALKKADGGRGKSMRFPIGLDMRRVFPSLAKVSLREKLPKINGSPTAKTKVALFTGCVMNFIYTDTGKAIVDILKANDVQVIIPKEQHCCGAPIFINGDRKIGVEMAKHNLDVFSKLDVDHLVFACGTCGSSFAEHYPHLVTDNKEYETKAEKLASKVIDIHPLLLKVGALNKKLGVVKKKVTYHDPCHLIRGMKISKEPREILKAIPGIEFEEMKEAARCCGGAGSFCLTHYDLSMEIHAHKVKNVKNTNASALATGCPACRMQFENGLAQANLNVESIHPILLLHESYKNSGLL